MGQNISCYFLRLLVLQVQLTRVPQVYLPLAEHLQRKQGKLGTIVGRLGTTVGTINQSNTKWVINHEQT